MSAKIITNAGFGIIAWSTALSRCDLDERTNRRQLRACFFSSQSRKILREKNAVGGEGGGVKNMAWVTGRRYTREQSAPQSREGGESNRVVLLLVFTKRKNARTRFALLVSGVLGKDGSVFHLLSHHQLMAAFFTRANGIPTLSRMP